MFIRIAKQKRGNKIYQHLQIAESFRDPEKGNSPRTRILAHLGTVEALGKEQIEKLIAGLQKTIGQNFSPPELLGAKDFGNIYAVSAVWDKLGLSDMLIQAGISGRIPVTVCDLIRLLVCNRLCDPCSKLALLDWLDTIQSPVAFEPSYHHLLRAMDRLIRIKATAEPLIAKAVLGKKEDVDLVFYDITSTYFEGGKSLLDEDIRKYGYSRDHRPDRRQVVIGMVISTDGIPLCHHVFSGNTADKSTVRDVVTDLKKRFKLRKIVFVGDRGMLSDANLEHLLCEDTGFIVAHPMRRDADVGAIIKALGKKFNKNEDVEQFYEDVRQGVRFVLAWSPRIAKYSYAHRQDRIGKADGWISNIVGKLQNPSGRGRTLSAQRAYDRIRDYLRDKNLLGLYHLELCGNELSVTKDRKALNWEESIDGMLLLETTDLELSPQDIVERYKELAEIERGWRTLKSSLVLRPVYHWTEKRIRAHVFICLLALQLERWMRNKLQDISVPKAMQLLRQIKIGDMRINGKPVAMVSNPTEEQKEILRKLGVKPVPALMPIKKM
jgi:transposase